MHLKFVTRFLIVYVALLVLFMLNPKVASAQTDTSSRSKKNTDQFLAPFEAFKAARNINGLVDLAEHNHYPFPEKVLGWQKQLQLNDRQKVAINQINNDLQRKVKEMNRFFITNERTLDSLFRYKKVNNGLLIYYTNRYGLYQGELRNALLQACLKTEAQLTDTQIKKYDALLQD